MNFCGKEYLLQLLRYPVLHPVPGAAGCFLLFLVLWLYPVNSFVTRGLLLLSLAGGAGGLLFIFRNVLKRKTFLLGAAAAGMILSGICLCFYSRSRLGNTEKYYVQELRSYAGTSYLWGGENALGIDCSGLPRKAMRNALFKSGAKTLNLHLWKLAFENYLYDASAKALAEETRNTLFCLGLKGSVASALEQQLRPGDLAVTCDGRHVMVFLAPGEWISADPGAGKVIIENPVRSKNPWFSVPVRFYRFSLFK